MTRGHLTLEERYVIEHLVRFGLGGREIGRRLGRAHTTIAREVHRNGQEPCGGEVYNYRAAERRAQARRRWRRARPKRDDARLWASVEAGLVRQWSPEQIAGRLRRDHPRSRRMRLSPETIYRWVYCEAGEGGVLYRHLRRHHKKRRRQRRYGAGRGLIPGRVGIAERPAIVETRARLGDWEGDLVEGAKGAGALATLVERKSRYLLAAGLASKGAHATAAAITRLLATVAQDWRHTLTLDNGKEFSRFKVIEEATGIAVYFADPYAAWQRGTNENTNGLIRQYLPKGCDMRAVSAPKLAKLIKNINHRPRKCLDFRTPHEVLSSASAGAFDM